MAVNFTSVHIPYAETKILSTLIENYLAGDVALKEFFAFTPDINGIEASIEQRQKFPVDRNLLADTLLKQYNGIAQTKFVSEHIELLRSEKTFTVCTAHQPNLFTGPLYFIYKIIHAIKLAENLKATFREYNFVPVYYVGSEDADLEELGKAVVDGKKYVWKTDQQGAVGRMLVDASLLQLLDELYNQLGVTEDGKKIVNTFKESYQSGVTIAGATRKIVHHLFGKYGLVVLDPDDKAFKTKFLPVAEKELKEGFSEKVLQYTLEKFPSKYKVQTAGRAINLFYLDGDKRKRIDQNENGFVAEGQNFNLQDLNDAFIEDPSRCSPNVVLRPVFQEMILPNVAFIGGGGELAYWLELKSVFNAVNVPFPVLILRNSYMVLHDRDVDMIEDIKLNVQQLFTGIHELERWLVEQQEGDKVDIQNELKQLKSVYDSLAEKSGLADQTLVKHTRALEHKLLDQIKNLEKKMIAAYKKKHSTEINRMRRIKETYFPSGGLQERTENVSGFYAKYGEAFIDAVYQHALGWEMQFTVLKPK